MDISHLNHYIQWYFNMIVASAYTLVGCVIIGIIIVFGSMFLLSEYKEFQHKRRRDY